MLKGNLVESLRTKYLTPASDLNERGRRHWAATEAMAIGYGGITSVAVATGLSDRTVKNGIEALCNPAPLTATPPTTPQARSNELQAAMEVIRNAGN